MISINRQEIKIKIPNILVSKDISFVLTVLFATPFIYYFIYFCGVSGLYMTTSMIAGISVIYHAHVFFKMCLLFICFFYSLHACFIYDSFPKYGILNKLNNLEMEDKNDFARAWPFLGLFQIFITLYVFGCYTTLDSSLNVFTITYPGVINILKEILLLMFNFACVCIWFLSSFQIISRLTFLTMLEENFN